MTADIGLLTMAGWLMRSCCIARGGRFEGTETFLATGNGRARRESSDQACPRELTAETGIPESIGPSFVVMATRNATPRNEGGDGFIWLYFIFRRRKFRSDAKSAVLGRSISYLFAFRSRLTLADVVLHLVDSLCLLRHSGERWSSLIADLRGFTNPFSRFDPPTFSKVLESMT